MKKFGFFSSTLALFATALMLTSCCCDRNPCDPCPRPVCAPKPVCCPTPVCAPKPVCAPRACPAPCEPCCY